jgi:hypothetical protein
MIGVGTGAVGYGIVGGHGNVAIGGQFTTLADQNDSITIADGDGNILVQYLTANGFVAANKSLNVTGYMKVSAFLNIAPTTVAGLAAADPVPSDGDRAYVTNAAGCTFGSLVSGGGSVRCPVYYDGSSTSWKAG